GRPEASCRCSTTRRRSGRTGPTTSGRGDQQRALPGRGSPAGHHPGAAGLLPRRL
ncbi:MAG: hypothetical protein AVDCRST_MAG41-2955, partial [uncultured Corynebacteriales bacterium]